VLAGIRRALPHGCVLVVDDGSPDGTADIAERKGNEIGGVEVLRRTSKFGLGRAYRAGFAWGLEHGWDAMVEMDADLSHDPDSLPDLLAGLDRGADLVIGSRYVQDGSIPRWSWYRRLISQGGNIFADLILGMGLTDSTSGFRAYRATMLQKLDLERVRTDGYGFQIEMAYRVLEHGGTVTEVPIRFIDRVEGKSKMSTRIVVEAFAFVVRTGLLRMSRPLRRTPCRWAPYDNSG
jgi:dolichol-phosphate mannosyltransferase